MVFCFRGAWGQFWTTTHYISIDEKPTYNSTWKVRIMLARILKKISRLSLKVDWVNVWRAHVEIHGNLLYIIIVVIVIIIIQIPILIPITIKTIKTLFNSSCDCWSYDKILLHIIIVQFIYFIVELTCTNTNTQTQLWRLSFHSSSWCILIFNCNSVRCFYDPIWYYTEGFSDLKRTLDYSPLASLYSHPKNRVSIATKSHGMMPLV